MATPGHGGSPPYYEPRARRGHAAVEVNGKIYLWGGLDSSNRPFPATEVEVFDTLSGAWSTLTTKGTPLTVDGTFTAIGDKIYTYGGWITGGQYSDAIHELNLTSMTWRKLTPKKPSNGPTKKQGCRMVSYNQDMLVLYGGDRGTFSTICDELHVYNLREDTWSSPRVTGTPPGLRAYFSFTKIDDQRVVLFGGNLRNRDTANDVYILDMQRWHWSKVPTSGGPSPAGRAGHTACSLSGFLTAGPHKLSQLLIMGGEDQRRYVLRDAWTLDLESGTWTQVELPGSVGKRRHYTAAVVACAPGSVHLLLFGGSRTMFVRDTLAATTVLQMEGGGKVGEPLRWRVVGVSTPEDPVTWKEWKQSQLIKLAKVQSLMKRKKTVNAKAATIIFIGTPGSGKSTTIKRMLNDLSIVVFSTPVAGQPLRVTIKKLSPTTAALVGCEWKEQSFMDEKLHLVRHALREFSRHEAESEIDIQTTASSATVLASKHTVSLLKRLRNWLSREASTRPSPPPSVRVGKHSKQPPLPATTDEEASVSANLPPTFEGPQNIIEEAVRAGALEEVEDYLQDSIFLNILDTGGQPEFMEVLPALLTGPSINLLVFKLNEGLEERYVVEYVSPDGSATQPYVSSFTVEEVLFQALSSVSCAVPPISPSISASAIAQSVSSSQSAVLFVGTHKDMVEDKEFEAIDDTLQRKLKNVSLPQSNIIHYDRQQPSWDLVIPADSAKPHGKGVHQRPRCNVVIPIDNTNPQDRGIRQLRELIRDALQKLFDTPDVPLSWLMFHLSARSTNSPLLTIQQCAVIGSECGIEDEEELKIALWYLSQQCGIFRYYPDVEELSDTVICDPNVLFISLSILVSSMFNFKGAVTETQARIRETGRCPVAVAKKLLEKQGDIPLPKLIKLLEHLCILCCIANEEGTTTEYFLPCILPTHPVETLVRDPKATVPLLITFGCRYCPLRLFSALVVYLASPQMTSQLKWRLYEGDYEDYKPHRNKVTLYVGQHLDMVTLIARPTFYEVWVDREREASTSCPLHQVCFQIRADLDTAVDNAKFTLNSSLRVSHHIAFYCQREHCHAEVHPAIVDDPTALVGMCTFTQLRSPLPTNHHIWCGQPVSDGERQTEPPLTATTTAPATENRTPLENVDDSQLDDDSLPDVITELYEVTRWFDLGLMLGLKYRPTLEIIKIQYRERVDDCKRDMVEAWLQKQDNVYKKGPPSWRMLVAALRSRPLVADCADIAEEIAQAHRII